VLNKGKKTQHRDTWNWQVKKGRRRGSQMLFKSDFPPHSFAGSPALQQRKLRKNQRFFINNKTLSIS